MKNKEIKINIPEGYEIDKENSTFERIKFKPIEELLNYDQIFDSEDGVYYIDYDGIVEWRKPLGGFCSDKNIATDKKQLEKVLAMNQLLNIAKYYNKNNPEFNIRYRICYDSTDFCYKVVTYAPYQYIFGVQALFNDKEDAKLVIDNPSFRKILDTIYRN